MNEEKVVKNEMIVKEKEITDMVVFNIPDETIEEIIAISDNAEVWAKVADGGFLISEKILPSLVGIIYGIHPYLIKWEEKQPTKIPLVS